jgi:hypothetical protein
MLIPRLAFVSLNVVVMACGSADRREPPGESTTHGPDTLARPSLNTAPVAMPAPCPNDTGQAVTVTRHCFGPMPVDSTLGFLAAQFPGYQASTQNLEDTPVLVWFYTVRGVTAMLSQQVGSMNLSRPAYEWRISGEGILLPGGVPLPKNWGDLRARFPGPAHVTGGELGSQVEICELNGVRIDLGRGEDLSGPADSVNPSTSIGQVVIYPTRRDSDCH